MRDYGVCAQCSLPLGWGYVKVRDTNKDYCSKCYIEIYETEPIGENKQDPEQRGGEETKT